MCGSENSKEYFLQTAASPELTAARPSSSKRRIHLHELGSWCCAILGTCLTHDDLMAMARKWNIKMDPDVSMFDVHGFFVTEAGRQCDLSRALQKLLDSRYNGFVRRIAKIKDHEGLVEFWNTSVNDGFVAGAFWAIVSHTHVPPELMTRVFGEVHMMSHLLGGSARKIVGAAAELQEHVTTIERRQDRLTANMRRSIERRDAKIVQLQSQLDNTRRELLKEQQSGAKTESRVTNRAAKLLLKRERALISSRAKTRQLEAELEAVNHENATLRKSRRRPMHKMPAEDYIPPKGLCGKAVLYLGGRADNVARIREAAEAFNVTFLHHDGGMEQSAQLIGDLVEKCDAVVCPVNCINHQACIKAKRICKRLKKPFMPIMTTGQSSFTKALGTLADTL